MWIKTARFGRLFNPHSITTKQTEFMKTYTIGTRCFCDFAFGGKPSGKVVEIITPGTGQSSTGRVLVELTETTGAYHKGEKLEVETCYAVPKAQELKHRAGQVFRRVNTKYQYA